MKDEFVSTEHLSAGLDQGGFQGQRHPQAECPNRQGNPSGDAGTPRQPASDRPEPRGQVSGRRSVTESTLSSVPGKEKLESGLGRDQEIRSARDPGPLPPNQRTAPCSSASRALARRPSSKGLALRIVDADVPEEALKNRRVIALDMERLPVARNQVPRRSSRSGSRPCSKRSRPPAYACFSSMNCTRSSAPGRGGGGSRTRPTLLGRPLGRGGSAALARSNARRIPQVCRKRQPRNASFQPVYVNEPSVEDTIAILRGAEAAARRPSPRREDQRLGPSWPGGRPFAPRYIADRFSARQGDRPPVDEAASPPGYGIAKRAAGDRRSAAASWCSWARRPPACRRPRNTPKQRQRGHPGGDDRPSQAALADTAQQWELEKSGLGDVHQIRSKLDEAELQFNHLSAAIKEKQSAGLPVPEADYQKLYELDMQRKRLAGQLESADKGEPQVTGRRLTPPRGRAGRNRRGRERMDRHTGQPHDGDGAGQAPRDGRSHPPADGQPGRGRGRRLQRRSAATAAACKIPTDRSGRSSSWGPRASVRPSSARPWRRLCSTTKTP